MPKIVHFGKCWHTSQFLKATNCWKLPKFKCDFLDWFSNTMISLEKAQEHIFGFTMALDLTARDLMKKNGGQCLLGKSMDGFCPLGPSLTTYDEVSDPHQLRLICQVNQETKQDSNSRQMIFDTNEIVAWCSQFCTLLPGDVILTGSPPGSGCFRKPPQFLQKGDVIECSIEKIGSMTTIIVWNTFFSFGCQVLFVNRFASKSW